MCCGPHRVAQFTLKSQDINVGWIGGWESYFSQNHITISELPLVSWHELICQPSSHDMLSHTLALQVCTNM